MPEITIGGDPNAFTFTASEGLPGFACSLDGGDFVACVSGASFGELPPGDHALQVRATDAAGNIGEATRAWTVAAPPVDPPPDNKPPPITPPEVKPPVVPAKVTFSRSALKLPSSGKVTAATIACGTARCAVTTPAKLTVKLGRAKYTLAIAVPRTVQAGKTGVLTITVPSALRKALKGKTLGVSLTVTVTDAGGRPKATKGTVKLRG